MTTIVIMPGGFHPFHAGHLALYQSAQRAFPGAEVFVAATNDTSARPFPFAVKEKLAKLAGVESGHFVQVKSPFRAEEITAKFDPNKDTLIFVRSEKDASKPPQAGGVKKDGSPAYLQPLLNAKKLEPFAKHAYMAYLPTVEFGPGMTSATEIRTAWPTLNDKRKTALVMSLYPRTQGNIKLATTVVRLLDAAIGTQGVAEGSNESYIIVRTDSEGKKDVFAGNFDTYEQAQKELDACLAHPLHTKYKQKFEIKRKDQQGVAEGPGGAILGGIAGGYLTKTPSGAITGARLGSDVQDLVTKENQGWAATFTNEVDAQQFVGGLRAGYQRRENQPVDEDYLDEKRL